MNVFETEIPDVKIIEPVVFGDHRGFFMESWNAKVFAENNLNVNFLQDNHSKSAANILRGLHYQVRHPQGKLVRVTKGEVFDVAVDLRRSSLTFGQWVGVILNEDNKRMLWIPPGFAHGFYVTSNEAEFLYKCTDYYMPEDERCIIWNDSTLDIRWPVDASQPVLSDKDSQGVLFSEAECFD